MKRILVVSVLTAFLLPVAITGCSSTHKSDSSSYEKSKSSSGKRREGSGGY